ncbi:MAG: trypsin-like peptidase domain-containing protein [Clostridiales bacterium]|nr:trypsin-like peptidase domain-containing protein [Clostridiales bacterium]
MKKRIVALFLILILTAGAAARGLALDSISEYNSQAETLSNLGLFLGTGEGFELERSMTRAEAAEMVVRLLGKEAEAAAVKPPHPFGDVPDWANSHVGYLYTHGISYGISETQYGSSLLATPSQYGTFLLRSLGYSDAGGDFYWGASLQSMYSLGIISNAEFTKYFGSAELPRAYSVAMSYTCLFADMKNSERCLLEELFAGGAISAAQLKAASADPNISPLANLYGIASPATGSRLTEAQVFNSCHDAVFRIDLYDEYGLEYGFGSGFFISSDGFAVTNFHVLESASSATALLPNGDLYNITGIFGFDPINDIALIKVDAKNVTYLTIGGYSSLNLGEKVYAIGCPGGAMDTISSGLVLRLNYGFNDSTYVLASAPIAPGSSGGALINEYGQVVGITSALIIDKGMSLSAPAVRISELSRRISPLSTRYFFAHTRYGHIPFGNLIAEMGDNDTVPVQKIPQDGIVAGNISDPFDTDVYSLTRLSAGTFFVSLTSDAANSGLLQFEILDSGGNVVSSSQHYEGEAFSFAMGHAANNVTYTVRVYTAAPNLASPVSYELYYVWLSPERGDTPVGEFEPNDNMATADYMPLGYTVSASLNSHADIDCYRVYLEKGGDFTATLLPDNSGPSLFYASLISAETGGIIAKERISGNRVYLTHDNLPSGAYYIAVSAGDGAAFDAVSGRYYISARVN